MNVNHGLRRSLTISALLSLLFQPSFAAVVPVGASLAKVQELVVGNGTEPASLDPHKVDGIPEMTILRDLLETLMIEDGDGKLVPGAAESWESADNKTFLFHLRQGATWSNGDPVTAQDFVYSFRRAVDPATGGPFSWYLEMTSMRNAAAILKGDKPVDSLGVSAVDAQTLKVELELALPYFAAMTTSAVMAPVHRATVEKYGNSWTRPEHFVGNGAYTLNQWVVNEKIALVRNPAYWDNAQTVIDKVTYLPIESSLSDMNRFLAGEVDMTLEVPNEHFKRLSQDHPESLRVTPYQCTYHYAFNNKKAPFNDVRVRQALSYAIDRDIVTQFITGKGETPAYIFAHPAVAGFTPDVPDFAHWTQKQRTDTAKALLAEAGFGPSNPLSFTLLYNTSDNHKKIAIAIASMWKKSLGVNVKLENQEWKTYLDNRRQGNYDVTRAGWCGPYNEASSFLALAQSNNGSNDFFYHSERYDQLMNNAMQASSNDERADNYRQAQALLAQDMPLAPIYHYVNAKLVRPTVGGYPMHNASGKFYTKDLYMTAQ
jgi:oligopeptide transport system substrate-binding protein